MTREGGKSLGLMTMGGVLGVCPCVLRCSLPLLPGDYASRVVRTLNEMPHLSSSDNQHFECNVLVILTSDATTQQATGSTSVLLPKIRGMSPVDSLVGRFPTVSKDEPLRPRGKTSRPCTTPVEAKQVPGRARTSRLTGDTRYARDEQSPDR